MTTLLLECRGSFGEKVLFKIKYTSVRKKKKCSNCENKEQKTFIWKVQSPRLPGECLLTEASKFYVVIETVHKHLLGALMQKGGGP